MGYQGRGWGAGEGIMCSNRIRWQGWEEERRRRGWHSSTQREQISRRQEACGLNLEELTCILHLPPGFLGGLEHPGVPFPKGGAVSSFAPQGGYSLGTTNPRHNFKASEACLSIFPPPCLHFLSLFSPPPPPDVPVFWLQTPSASFSFHTLSSIKTPVSSL